MDWESDGAGTAECFTFLIAGSVFVASMLFVLYSTSTLTLSEDEVEHAVLERTSRSLLDMVTQSPGVGMSDGPDGFQRFGLLTPDGRGLDPAIAGDLCGTSRGSPGGFDYGHVARSLQVDPQDGIQFHLRLEPTTVPLTDFSQVKTAYVGQMAPDATWTPPKAAPGRTMVAGAQSDLGGASVKQLETYFSTTAVSEKTTIGGMGLDHDPMPDRPHPAGHGKGHVPKEHLRGDQFFDDATYLSLTLAQRIDEYDLILIGTDVDHGELEPLSESIEAWVLQGGRLILMGTHDADGASAVPAWLQSLYPTDGPPTAATRFDAHPVFDIRHRLQASDFKGSAPFKLQAEPFLEDVLPAHGTGTSHLALSPCGALGDGFLARLSYREADELAYTDYRGSVGVNKMTSADTNSIYYGSVSPSARLLENLITYSGWQDLHLDLGPPVPHAPAAHSMRIINYDHPMHGPLAMEAHIHVWRT